MSYDPRIHHRRSIRLKGYDYTRPGAYFVTMVTQDRAILFGEVVDENMVLNPIGKIVADYWQRLPQHFPTVRLDAFILMPNHFHGIIVIVGDGGRGEAVARQDSVQAGLLTATASPQRGPVEISPQRPIGTVPGSLNAIIQNFKSISTRKINQARAAPGVSVWQRDYFEHILRDNAELNRIRRYIADNPRRWTEDRENPRRW